MENYITLKIDEDFNFLVEKMANGVISNKTIKPTSFVNLVKKSIKQPVISSGILPNNCICFSSDEKGNKFVALDFDIGSINKIYEKTTYKEFPIPRMVFGFKINNSGNISKVFTGVLEKGKITPKTKMYKYPFSNVKDFSLCTGGNTLPKIESLHQLDGIPYYIFSMPDNNDEYKKTNTKLKMEYRNMLEHLKDKSTDYYYSNILIESGKTLMDFLSIAGKD